LLTPSVWVELLDRFLKLADGDVRIDLGGTDRRMTEKLLNRAQIGAVVTKVSRKTVAEHVRVDMLEASSAGSGIEDESDRVRGDRLQTGTDRSRKAWAQKFLGLFFGAYLLASESHVALDAFAICVSLVPPSTPRARAFPRDSSVLRCSAGPPGTVGSLQARHISLRAFSSVLSATGG
jgi:hypothetical protein